MRCWLALLLIWPSLVISQPWAQDTFPAWGHVVNVADDDVLNIRIDPDHTSEVIGSLPPDATQIEVVSEDDSGRWGLVNSNEASGWVRLSYLSIPDQPKWHEFSQPLGCYGTEPFWSFDIMTGASSARFEDIEMSPIAYDVSWVSEIHARPAGTVGIGAGSDTQGFSALIENQLCHDGMSDRESALRIRLFVHGIDGTAGYDGCCALSP